MKFLQDILRVEPLLRSRGMTVEGNDSHVAIHQGEKLITFTKTHDGHYVVTSMCPGGEPKSLGTVAQSSPEVILKKVFSA